MAQSLGPSWRHTQPRRQQTCWHSCSRHTQQQQHSSSSLPRKSCHLCPQSPLQVQTGLQAAAEEAASCRPHQQGQQQGPGSSSSRQHHLLGAHRCSSSKALALASGGRTACLLGGLPAQVSLARAKQQGRAAGGTALLAPLLLNKVAGRHRASSSRSNSPGHLGQCRSSSSSHGSRVHHQGSWALGWMQVQQQDGQAGSMGPPHTMHSSSSSRAAGLLRSRTPLLLLGAHQGQLPVLQPSNHSLGLQAVNSSSSCSVSTAWRAPLPQVWVVGHPTTGAVQQCLCRA